MESSRPEDRDVARDLVVIGASAGGVEALRTVVAGLPADLPAAVCVVLHIAPTSPSALAHILDRAGDLPCRAAVDGASLDPAQVLVAPPDRHLIIDDGCVRLSVGPRENGHRPSIDALFRSAAYARGPRVIGVVLSGTRDDGTVGLAIIQARGGATVVQDPKEALYAGMPSSAIAHVSVDSVVPSGSVAGVIVAMVNGNPSASPDPPGARDAEPGDPQLTTICPECGGVLTERMEVGVPQWECRVGHRYSPESLMDAQATDVEAAMWAAVRALEDRQILLERMARQARERRQPRSSTSFVQRAREAGRQAQLVRDALAQAAAGPLRELDPHEAEDIAPPAAEERG